MLFVGLSSWIIQDGNYGDFRVGEEATFAVEFAPLTIEAAQSQGQSFERLGASRYRVCGQVIYLKPSVWVIDFGVMVYENTKPPPFAKKGSWVEGEVYLGVDPFFYFEELHALTGMPALQYRWRIKAIHLETTPWLRRGRVFTREKPNETFVEVAETDAWQDDDGRAHYVLECEEIGPGAGTSPK